MKIAISVPNAIFEAAERIAERLNISRSQLYSQAVETFVKAHRGEDIREALETVYGAEPSELDPVIEQLQFEALREEW